MMEKRRNMRKNRDEFKQLNKNTKKEIRTDIRTYKTKLIQETIENNPNIKVSRTKLTNGRTKLTKPKSRERVIMTNKNDITKVELFYTEYNGPRTNKT